MRIEISLKMSLELPGPIRLHFFIKSLLKVNGIYTGAPRLNSLTFLYYVFRVLNQCPKLLEPASEPASQPPSHPASQPVIMSHVSKVIGFGQPPKPHNHDFYTLLHVFILFYNFFILSQGFLYFSAKSKPILK